MYPSLLADLAATGPILLVALMGIVIVLVDSFRNDSPLIPWLAGGTLALALVIEVLRLGEGGTAFEGHVLWGGTASFADAVILLGALGSVILSVPYLKRIGHNYGEVHALVLFATVGMMVLASAGSLITLFVGLETMSVCLYVLTGLMREDAGANESALKYFLLGAFSTGFFLYGIALLYGATATMMLAEMPLALAETGRTGFFMGGLALLLVGFFFKVSAVPFHMWTPDVYQGAPTTLTGFMSTASKTAAFAALIIVLYRLFPLGEVAEQTRLILAVVAAVTMVVGNVLALAQANVKRMLAYSSIAHAGYILAGLAAGTAAGFSGALYYLLAYTVMNVGAFGVMAVLEWDDEQGAVQTVDSLAGMGFRKPLLGVTMGVFMFALTGFPPLAGFFGKYFVFAAAVDGGLTWLAVVGVLASAVSAYYYLRVLVAFWMRSPDEEPEAVQREGFAVSMGVQVVLVACAVGLLVLGLVPGIVTELAGAL
ncbi:MAG: NADH-quinone oxidoreductase subunit N, partial [Rhodothermaceae bacterium]|nr:NADH-quinone oxidoreductase subunit N [Rhodothermaceae bacterium]